MELKLLALFLILATSSTRADNGSDNANNLFSDLAPLLALFGEQFAKQFLSESMGWLDNIIFSMAPLGILTAIVGAIRVGGPVWLKAVIGRARENKATAEIELMSSTSHEVGELWNGTAVVRSLGRPEIAQIIHLTGCPDEATTFGLYTLEEAAREGLLNEEPYHQLPGAKYLSGKPGPDPEAAQTSGSPNTPQTQTIGPISPVHSSIDTVAAPNISLNLHGGCKKSELYAVSITGILLQSGVLVFTGFTVYHPTWRENFLKNDAAIMGYAYPLLVVGTVLLVIGMLICSAVIERSTHETVWTTRKPLGLANTAPPVLARPPSVTDDLKKTPVVTSKTVISPSPSMAPLEMQGRILWLQRRHFVSDQSFDSFMIFARNHRRRFRTSRRSIHESSTNNKPPALIRGIAETISESLTLVGAFVGLGGFVLQFQAFRGMHWSASIAQLVAVFIMTVLRAWLRRGLTVQPVTVPVIEQHEMDSLALGIATNPDFWDSGTGTSAMDNQLSRPTTAATSSRPREHPKNPRAANQILPPSMTAAGDWKIVACDGNIALPGSWSSLAHPIDETLGGPRAVRIRKRLGQLTQWPGPASQSAHALGKAIEVVMQCFFGDNAAASSSKAPVLSWYDPDNGSPKAAVSKPGPAPLLIATGQPQSFKWCVLVEVGGQRQKIVFSVAAEGGVWRADPEELEAALSLWLLHLHLTRTFPAPGTLHKRVLGPNIPAVKRDLSWWIEGEFSHGIDEDSGEAFEAGALVVGFKGTEGEEERAPGQLKTSTAGKVELLLAQHIFSSFLWAITGFVPNGLVDERATVLNKNVHFNAGDNTALLASGLLSNPLLTRLATDLQKTELLSLGDAYTFFIPPLSCANKLPVERLVHYMWSKIRNFEDGNRLEDAMNIYVNLIKISRSLEMEDRFTLTAYASAVGFCSLLSAIHDRRVFDSTDPGRGAQVLKIKAQVVEALREGPHGEESLVILRELYKLYDRAKEIDHDILGSARLGSSATASSKQIDNISPGKSMIQVGSTLRDRSDVFKLSPLHEAIIEQEAIPNLGIYINYLDTPDLLGFTPLHYAMVSGGVGQAQLVSDMLKKGADPTAKDIAGWTPLHYAALRAPGSTGDQLLRHDSKMAVVPAGPHGILPIHCGAAGGNTEMMMLLLVLKSVDVNAQDSVGWTPLHWAAWKGQNGAVKLLLDRKADLGILDRSGLVAAHWANQAGHESTVDIMLERMGDGLHDAAANGNLTTVEFLLKKGADPDAVDSHQLTPLHHAIRNEHEAAAKLLLQHKATVDAPDQRGETPLHWAIAHEKVTLAQLLLENKADPNRLNHPRKTPMHVAAARRNMEIMELLRKYNGSPSQRDGNLMTALHIATQAGDADVAKKLLDLGANTEITCGSNYTALYYATLHGFEDIAESLLEHKANPNTHDSYRQTPFLIAAARGFEKLVRLLVKHGADTEWKDANEQTALHHAVDRDDTETVKLLLELGVDTESTSESKFTALHYAATAFGREEITRYLLKAGASISAKDNMGETPLDLARKKGITDMVRLLERAGEGIEI